MPPDAAELERYFRDPAVGDAVLGIGSVGLACKNIRLGLRYLDLHPGIDFTETFDEKLAHAVLRLQEAYQHTARDGQFGPGTRRLLVRVLLETGAEGLFNRMGDPERREAGQVFVSYARADAAPVRAVVERVRGAGYRAWYDDNIGGSEHFNAAIQQAIDECYLMLVALSEASVASDWVVKEVMFANAAGIAILPVALGPLPASHPLKLVLINHQMLEAGAADFPARLMTAIRSVRARVLGL